MTDATSPTAPVDDYPPRPVKLSTIERDLDQLLKPDPADDEHRGHVLRACMSNLIVACSSEDQASVVSEELDVVVRYHPSRVLLLVAREGGSGAEIDVHVSAHCHIAGELGKVCSEQVTIRASSDAVHRLPSAARSLLIGDLPTSLWWAGHEAPPLGGELFAELEAMADQVIYSSLTWSNPVRDTVAAANWVKESEYQGRHADDLVWRRLKPWRNLAIQSLDPSAMPGALDAITRVEVEHGHRARPQSWLLIGWLASRLGWQPSGGVVRRGGQTRWSFDSPHGPVEVHLHEQPEGDPELRRLAVTWTTGGRAATMTFASNAPGRLGVTCQGVDAQPRTLNAPHQSRAELVGIQLQDLAGDPLFLEAMRVARRMAEALEST